MIVPGTHDVPDDSTLWIPTIMPDITQCGCPPCAQVQLALRAKGARDDITVIVVDALPSDDLRAPPALNRRGTHAHACVARCVTFCAPVCPSFHLPAGLEPSPPRSCKRAGLRTHMSNGAVDTVLSAWPCTKEQLPNRQGSTLAWHHPPKHLLQAPRMRTPVWHKAESC